MRDYHNLEPSKLYRNQYVGYCYGSWQIKKEGRWWIAKTSAGHQFGPGHIAAKTLGGISERLAEIEKDNRLHGVTAE